MFFVDCEVCDASTSGFSASERGWVNIGETWLCPEHNKIDVRSTVGTALASFQHLNEGGAAPVVSVVTHGATIHDLTAHLNKRAESAQVTAARATGFGSLTGSGVAGVARKPKLDPLQKEFGFSRPEDGSEERYRDRLTAVPWVRHAFWWWVHNAIAHPIIAVFPKRLAFQFHDWTSRKMHNQ